jgi:hypothetical protein
MVFPELPGLQAVTCLGTHHKHGFLSPWSPGPGFRLPNLLRPQLGEASEVRTKVQVSLETN